MFPLSEGEQRKKEYNILKIIRQLPSASCVHVEFSVRFALFQKLNMTLSRNIIVVLSDLCYGKYARAFSFHDYEPRDNGELPLTFPVT